MSQYYGNPSHSMNRNRLLGRRIDTQIIDFRGYLSDRQIIRQKMIAENNKIDMLLKTVHLNIGFKSNRIFYQDSIKYLKGADSESKLRVIKKLEKSQNNDDKILKILDKMKKGL